MKQKIRVSILFYIYTHTINVDHLFSLAMRSGSCLYYFFFNFSTQQQIHLISLMIFDLWPFVANGSPTRYLTKKMFIFWLKNVITNYGTIVLIEHIFPTWIRDKKGFIEGIHSRPNWSRLKLPIFYITWLNGRYGEFRKSFHSRVFGFKFSFGIVLTETIIEA